MLDWIDFFFKTSILCGLLTIYLLLFKKNALRSFSDYLLSAFILCQCWTILLFILVYSGSILNYPHLYKSAAPLTFLIGPLGYFYVRSMLFNEVAFKKIDLLHALPFLFVTLNYLPFFASSTIDKLDVLTATIEDANSRDCFLYSSNDTGLYLPLVSMGFTAAVQQGLQSKRGGTADYCGYTLAQGIYPSQFSYPI